MVAYYGSSRYGTGTYVAPILITATAEIDIVGEIEQLMTIYVIDDFLTSPPTSASEVGVTYATDLTGTYPTLRTLAKIQENDVIAAEDVDRNYSIIQDTIGFDADVETFEFTPIAYLTPGSISNRSSDGLQIAFQAAEDKDDNDATFSRPRPDFKSGSTILNLSASGMSVYLGTNKTGNQTKVGKVFSITPAYVYLDPDYTFFEHINDPEEPVPTTTTTTTTPRPTTTVRPTTTTPRPTTTPKPDFGVPTGTVLWVICTDSLYLRTAPDQQSAYIRLMPWGTKLYKLSGSPVWADSYEWWPVKDLFGNRGWAARICLSTQDPHGNSGDGNTTTKDPNEGQDGGACYISTEYNVQYRHEYQGYTKSVEMCGTDSLDRLEGFYYYNCTRDEINRICYGEVVDTDYNYKGCVYKCEPNNDTRS